tara:strand:- start:953 stop:1873 length:921 start_codon:yes stop_codon:yes gene_type:complete
VFSFRAVSGSLWNYVTSSDSDIKHINTQEVSMSLFGKPSWFYINNRYYEHSDKVRSFASNDDFQKRQLRASASVLSIPKKFYDMQIKPRSVEITDNSTDLTLTLLDDGIGNIYDSRFSQSFTTYVSSSNISALSGSGTGQLSGSQVGNIFYKEGVIIITETGSAYKNVFQGTGADGFEIDLKSQTENTEYEYICDVPEFKFNKTTNISVTAGRSGSISIPESGSAWKFFPPGANPTNGTGSYSEKRYEAAEEVENFATHSTFSPYVTTVGLYNDNNQLMALGKLARPIKNEEDLALSIVVRFDVPS